MLGGRWKTSTLQLKPWQIYSHKRSLMKRWSPKRQTFKNGCLLPAFIIHLASNFIHTCDFQPNLITFPLPAIIVLFANLSTLGVPSFVPSISVLVTWNAFQGFFCCCSFHWQASFFPLGTFLLASLQSVTPAALLKSRNTDTALLWGLPASASEWMIHRQAPSNCTSQIQPQFSRMKNWLSVW